MIGKIKYGSLFLCLLLATGCANMVTPTGGPKDITPPKVVKAVPENHSTHFNGTKVELTFDEFINLENANQNVLISPPMSEKPDIKLSNKTVVIKFKEPLAVNTTYTINFGAAIKDYHEGNLFQDYQYSFATGESLDTLSIAGKVMNLEKGKTAEDLFVGLYSSEHDSLFERPTHYPPDFITKTDKEGRFHLHGLPDKQFLVFALKDMNSNLYYDLPNETVAFLDTLVPASFRQQPKKAIDSIAIPTDSIAENLAPDTLAIDTIDTRVFNQQSLDLVLYAFNEIDTTQMLLEKKLIESGLLRFVFRQPAEEVSIELPEIANDTFQLIDVWSPTHDTLWYYFTPGILDSLRVHIHYDTIINDSTRYNLHFRESRQQNKKTKKPNMAITVSNNVKNNLLMPGEEFILKFSEPVTRIEWHDTSTFKVNDSIQVNALSFEKADAYGMEYRLACPILDSVEYSINITDSVFYSVRGRTNDSIHLQFKRAMEKDIGNIFITVVPPDSTQLVIQLVDSKDKVIDTCVIDSERRVEFKRLLPEKYKLKAIIDSDRNGMWSTGNFHRRFLPETVVDYKDELDVKAGWDIDLEEKWILFSK